MSWLRSLFSRGPRLHLAPDALPASWAANRVAVFAYLDGLPLNPDGSLPDPGCQFPGQHFLGQAQAGKVDSDTTELTPLQRAQAQEICSALYLASQDHTPARLARVYQALLSASPHCGDVLLERIDAAEADPARLAMLARWLVRRAPDLIAVRLGVALLGHCGSTADTDMLMTLGRHEEFTLPAAKALTKLLDVEPAQTALWNLARRVQGWGRVHVVRQLSTTACPEVQQWLLRDGFRNTVDDNMLALPCAVGGRLLQTLQAPQANEHLLSSVSALLQAILNGNAGQFDDGDAVLLAYLRCVERLRPRQLPVLATVQRIAQHASANDGRDAQLLREINTLTEHIAAFDYWPRLVPNNVARVATTY